MFTFVDVFLLLQECIGRDVLVADLSTSSAHLHLVPNLPSELRQLEHLSYLQWSLIVRIVATSHVVAHLLLIEVLLHHDVLLQLHRLVFGLHVEEHFKL